MTDLINVTLWLTLLLVFVWIGLFLQAVNWVLTNPVTIALIVITIASALITILGRRGEP